MEQTTRERIAYALRDRLAAYPWETWQPDVYVGRSVFDPDQDPMPVLTIVPGVENAEQSRYGTDLVDLTLDLSALVSLADGQDVTAQCEPIFGEIRRACFAGGAISLDHTYTDDGGAEQTATNHYALQYRGGGILDYPAELGPALVTVGVTLATTYETDIGEPHT